MGEQMIRKEENKDILKIILIAITFTFCFIYIKSIFKYFLFLLGIVSPFIAGAALAFVLKIPMNFFIKLLSKVKNEKFKKFIEPLALLITLIILGAFITLVTYLIIPQLINAVKALEEKIPEFIKRLVEFLKKNSWTAVYGENLEKTISKLSWDKVFDKVKGFFDGSNSKIYTSIIGTASGIFGAFMDSFLAFVFAIYILLDKKGLERQFKKLIKALFKEKSAYIFHVLSITHNNFYYFVKGQVFDAIILGLLTFVGMIILRLPYGPMISVIAATSDLVPLVGPFIGTALGVVFILIESPTKALIYLIYSLVIQQIQGNFIYPKIVGGALSIPPMWSLFAIIVGGSLYGIIGMWVFVPLFAVVFQLLREYTNKRITNI